MRYVITRPCLQEGSLRLLKYLGATFPSAGPVTLLDDRGQEYTAQVDPERQRVWGLGALYQAQNLGVNDVLVITPLTLGRYQVEGIVKPHAPPPAPRRDTPPRPETRRVVVSSTPHVREVRLQEVGRAEAARPDSPPRTEAARAETTRPEASRPEAAAPSEPRTEARREDSSRPATAPRPRPEASPEPHRAVSVAPVTPDAPARRVQSGSAAPVKPLDVRFASPASPSPAASAITPETQLAELARLTGYRLDQLGGGVLRLKADLGAHGYSVLVATSEAAVQTPAWKEQADYCVLLTTEQERPAGTPRLTREALAALIDHAMLAPLSAVELRGYWKAGSVDLESAASVAELVGAHLAQRGAFSAVLLTLAQQPAHSVVSVQRLAERLGSGVTYAELGGILDTLTRAPFLALTPLPGGGYLLRAGVPDLLTDLTEYAEGVRRRLRVPAERERLRA
ncbi:hypothetical protein GO986_14400 [Deinococcus sp. HMF7620]|uniref:Uncharacterized protein n=1 Tax=Deinococcus arboris TaxID=2682977 RepID=A0A7C9HZZ9_9DEIO|nr:hypothetical protein [Deinococcus arboris]MVN87948.1 hypothetical protein [Deinococcus arboris]